MGVVLDSNLIASALIAGAGVPARVPEARHRGRFRLVLSEEQLEELRRVTRYERVRPMISSQAAGILLNELRVHAHMLADLLSLKAFQRTRIITVRQFLGQLGERNKRASKRKVAAPRRRKRKAER